MRRLMPNYASLFHRTCLLVGCVVLLAFPGMAHATRTISSVTLNGSSATVINVTPSETFSATVNVVITNYNSNFRWRSTRWTLSSGATACVDTTDYAANGTYSEALSGIAAPATAGTYNFTIATYSGNSCSTNIVSTTLNSAIIVAAVPTVSSIVRASTNPADTNTSVSWTVTFSKAVTGVDASDFELVQSYGVSGASITSVSGSGTTWTVTANTGNGNYGGDLGLNLVDDDTIVDSGGRMLGGTGTGNGNYTGPMYIISPPCLPPSNAPAGLVLACVCDNFNRTSLNPSTINNSNWLASISSASDTTGILPNITNRGYLRLTNNTTYNGKAATVPGVYPASGNYISVEFRLYAYNGSNADGMAVTLSNYAITPVPGSSGGSLGYAQKTNISGFAGGWIGVGIDEFGNYQNPSEGRVGGPGARAQSVAVRGSGIYNSATNTWPDGYAWLGGTAANISPALSNASSTTPAPGHIYQVIVDARSEPTSTAVAVNRDTGSGYSSLVSLPNVYAAAIAQGTTQAAVPANWQISFTGSTGASTNIHEIGAVRICAQTSYPPTGGVASGFNAIDEAYGTAPAVQSFLTGHIFTKLIGTPFKLDVAALDNNQVLTTYAISGNKTVTVNLVDNSDGVCILDSAHPNYCSTSCTNKTAVSGGNQTMTFVSADAGKKQSANFTINTAYKNLVAIIKDGTTTACSTDAFSVRPLSFQPVTTTATGTTGLPRFKAGNETFSIIATTNGIAGYASGYTGVPKVNNALVTGSTVAGSVVGTFPAATSGTPSSTSMGTNFTYSEVGTFTLAAQGVYEGVLSAECGSTGCDTPKISTWTGVDSVSSKGDCVDDSFSNVKDANGKYGCLFGTSGPTTFGRFIPDHFALLDGSIVTPACGGATGFTYMSQPFGQLRFDLEAQNGTNGKTKNYAGTAAVTVVAENANNGADLTARVTGVPAATWTAGSYSVDTAAVTLSRMAAGPDGPYDTLQFGVSASDEGGSVTMGGMNMRTTTTGVCTTGTAAATDCDSRRLNDTSASVAQPTIVRFGRLRLMSAHGSERLNLPIPMTAQFWNGSMFVTNTLDNCTAISNGNVGLVDYQGGITSANIPQANVLAGTTGTSMLASGVGRLTLKKPTGVFSSRGSVDVCVDLGPDTPAAPLPTRCAATSAAMPWLQGRWVNPSYIDDPRVRATFGVYKNEFIYFREIH